MIARPPLPRNRGLHGSECSDGVCDARQIFLQKNKTGKKNEAPVILDMLATVHQPNLALPINAQKLATFHGPTTHHCVTPRYMQPQLEHASHMQPLHLPLFTPACCQASPCIQ